MLLVDEAGEADGGRERVGPFRIVRELGRGGMGTVFLAERDDGQFEHRVALKVIRHRDSADGPDLVPRFLEERRILARLEHPSIAHLVDGGITDDGTPWFAMEYVAGEAVDHYCDARELTVDQRLELFTNVCDAVQYAHQHFVVHRDLKPSNILVTAAGQLKLLDFGVAKLLDPMRAPDEPATTDTVVHAMTPEYAAPEQVRGDPVSAATDVYALGVLLFVLLTGERPYEVRGRSLVQMERIICDVDPTPPSATLAERRETSAQQLERARVRGTTPDRLRRRLAGDLDLIVLKALRKEPGARYASAYELARDIRRHLTGHPVLARRQTGSYRARRFVSRHRVEVFAASGVALSLVAGALLALAQARHARDARDRAVAASRETAATNAFLLRLFEASSPEDAHGDTMTAGELAHRAEERIDKLRGEPVEQARLLVVMGHLYQSLGRYTDARAALERAISLRLNTARRASDDDLEQADALLQLSHVRRALDNFGGADSAARGAMAIQSRILGSTHPRLAITLHQLASIAVYRGDLAAAEGYAHRALAIRDAAAGPEDSSTVQSHLLLGAIFRQEGRLTDAEHEFRRALAISERFAGQNVPSDVSVVQQLALLLDEDEGRSREAEALYQRALAMTRRAYGDGRPETAASLFDLADFLSRTGRGGEAIVAARQFLAIVRRVYGPEHPLTATAIGQTAAVLFHAGDTASAEPLFREAIAMGRRLRGKDHESVAGVETSFARLLIDRGDYAAARAELDDALRIAVAVFGPEHIRTEHVRGVVGDLLLHEGRYAAADSVLRHAIEIIGRQTGSRQHDVAELYRWLGDAEDGEGLHDAAERHRAIAAGRE
jgi:serine/threonine-protein kinase